METVARVNNSDAVTVVRLGVEATCCVSSDPVPPEELCVKLQSGSSFAVVALQSLDILIDALDVFTPSEDFVKWQLDGTRGVVYYQYAHIDVADIPCMMCDERITGGQLLTFSAAFNNRLSEVPVACHGDCYDSLHAALASVWERTPSLLMDAI